MNNYLTHAWGAALLMVGSLFVSEASAAVPMPSPSLVDKSSLTAEEWFGPFAQNLCVPTQDKCWVSHWRAIEEGAAYDGNVNSAQVYDGKIGFQKTISVVYLIEDAATGALTPVEIGVLFDRDFGLDRNGDPIKEGKVAQITHSTDCWATILDAEGRQLDGYRVKLGNIYAVLEAVSFMMGSDAGDSNCSEDTLRSSNISFSKYYDY